MIKVGITHGDINGIGYEVILKTFSDARLLEIFTPVIYGSLKLILAHRKAMNLPQIQFNQVTNEKQILPNRLNIINCVDDNTKLDIGMATPSGGRAAFLALEKATDDLSKGLIDVLVTAPISKENIQSETFVFPGHTEYLENKFSDNNDSKSLMLLVSDNLRIAIATGHIPLAKVSDSLSQNLIEGSIKTLNETLKRDFRIETPKIAVLGLNPHAGENGLLGKEEIDIITPTVKKLQDEMIICYGPFSADGFFGKGEYKKYDAILAMYHDQGLIPFKTLAMESGVNYTAGISVIRTSPAHGTAFDIAGKGVASEESFRQAIYLAIDAYRNRKDYDDPYKNPLRKMFFDRGNDNVELPMSSED